MNYNGQVSCQRLPPTMHSGREDYGREVSYGKESQQEWKQSVDNRDSRVVNQHADFRFNVAQQHRHPPLDSSPQPDGYRNEPTSAPTHRYPETFRVNEQHSRRNSPHGSQGDGNQQYQAPNNYDSRNSGRPEPPMNLNNRDLGYESRRQYGENHHGRDDSDFHEHSGGSRTRLDGQAGAAPAWSERSDHQPNIYNRQTPVLRQSRDRYEDHHGRGDLNWVQHRQQNDHTPNLFDQSKSERTRYNQHDQLQEPYRDSHRGNGFSRDSQPDRKPSSDSPQVFAETSGPTAVFGIVKRPDAPPTKGHLPPFGQYRDTEPKREQHITSQTSSHQHQYHHALAPISEKPSPPVSINYGGQQLGPASPKKPSADAHNQYLPSDGFRKSWHDDRPGGGYHDQRHTAVSKPGYDVNPHSQYQGRPQDHGSAPRDHEHAESSGYGSESTYNTERSYGEPQRFNDKGQYGSRFSMENNRQSPPSSLARGDGFRDDGPSHGYGQRDGTYGHTSHDSYGPPVSGQRQYNDSRPLSQNNRHNQDHDHAPPPPRQNEARSYSNTRNVGSGVEESHVPSVRAARNMFETRSDPRRPPPAPKPLIAPKPNNVNARPVPPRPRPDLSSNGWGRREVRDSYPPRFPQGPQYEPASRQRSQPAHSQSMDNLDERSRCQPPSSQFPHHTQSMQNLDERSRYQQAEENYSQRANRRSFERDGSNAADDRPMVVAVKFNQDTGPSLFTGQESSRQGSWERPQTESRVPRSEYVPQVVPMQSHGGGRGWTAEPRRDISQQSYDADNRNAASSSQSQHGQSRPQDADDESGNYVPDVVARSYELARQSQQAASQPNYNNTYSNQQQGPIHDGEYNPNRQNISENRNSASRWPTPPSPIYAQEQSSGNNTSYNDEWRRPGTVPTHPHDNSGPSGRQPDQHLKKPHGFKLPGLSLPPPPQQPYRYDSDSSEVDVDAPTPPSTAQAGAPKSIRGSHYERNKPIPVGARNPDSLKRLQQQLPQNVQEQRPEALNSKRLPKNLSSAETSPQTPQRNSTSQSPQFPLTPNDQDDFDLDIGITQRLANPSSREKMRLMKSGAMANRKPPRRPGSTSDLIKSDEKEDDFQIDVTDNDISNRATPIEVHRLESMRILKAKKEKERDSASSGQDRPAKQRASKKVVPPPTDDEDELSSSKPATKRGTKLVYKVPTAEAAKITPLPQVTEPVADSSKRPPTYLGFGYTPEKPKSDLLSQFKSVKDSALRTAAEKQDKALKSVSALVKFSHGKKEPKAPPKPKLTPAERNAKALNKMNVEVHTTSEEDHDRHHRHRDERGDVIRSSTRSTSTAKLKKYDGDDDTTNESRHGRDARGRMRGGQRDRAKSRGRSSSRGRNLSPAGRAQSRHRSKSRERALSPEDRHRSRRERTPSPEERRRPGRPRSLSPEERHRPRRQRSLSLEERHRPRRPRSLSPDERRPRRQRSLSPDDQRRPRRDIDNRRYYEDSVHSRRHRDDESSFYQRPYTPPDPRRYHGSERDWRYQRPPSRGMYRLPPSQYDRHRPAQMPESVGQYRRGRGHPGHHHPARRAWVNDPRRTEVTIEGKRRYARPPRY